VGNEVVDATLPHLPEVVADMVRLQRVTGCRPAEVCLVRPCDVDTSGDVWIYRPESHKTEHHGRARIICIGPKGQDVLCPYLLQHEGSYCFSPIDSERKRLAALHARRRTPFSCGNRPGTNRANRRIGGVLDA
jgi:integrase